MPRTNGKKRDFLAWIGVVADIAQVLAIVAALIGALYWYVLRPGGLAAAIVAMAVCMLGIGIGLGYLLYTHRKQNVTR